MRQDRLEREELERQQLEEKRRREKLERQRLAEEKRIQDLEDQALRWERSKRLRAYIAEVKTVALTRGDDGDSRKKLDQWVVWASQHADRLDPLTHGLPF